MSHALIIQLSSTKIHWCLLDEFGKIIKLSVADEPLDLPHIKKHTVFVIVPAADVFLTEVKLPKISHAKLMKAIPFALEEQISDAPANIHFSIGSYLEDNRLPIAIVSKEKMTQWISLLKELLQPFDLTLNRFVPETLVIPFVAGTWVVTLINNMVVVRTEYQAGFSADPEQFWKILRLMIKNSVNKPLTLEFLSEIDIPAEEELYLTQSSIDIKKTFVTNLFPVMAELAYKKPAINLLQNDYKPSSLIQNKWLSKTTIWFFIAWISIISMSQFLQIIILHSQNHQLKKHILSYSHLLPAQNLNISNIKSAMQQEVKLLQKTRQENRFLSLLHQVIPLMFQEPQVEIKKLEYSTNTLTLLLEVDEFSQIDTLNKNLRLVGLKLEQQQTKKTGNKIQVKFIIQDTIL